jgi:D-arabinose 1-dehydrogenase-like Zn-dependent alcohol dehydrogenase
VRSCPGGEFAVGTKVAALMGGMGRSINGSYAEFTRPPATNVAQIGSDLPWEDLAAIPQSYATAWTCLFRNLELAEGQTLVIRGAMSSFGQAALNLAVNAGANVIATARRQDLFQKLEALGARRVEIEAPDLAERIAERNRIDAVLDLVGNSTILDSLAMLRRGGRACLRAFWAVLLRCPTSIPCCRCRAVSTSASSAVLCSANRAFPCRMSRSRPSPIKWQLVVTKQNQSGYFASRTFAKRIE